MGEIRLEAEIDSLFNEPNEKNQKKHDIICLADVHTVVKKWLFLSDNTIIDLILATVLTNQKKGTPVWIIIVDQSGEAKSELLRTLHKLPNTILISDLNNKAFVSGNPSADDLFSKLRSKNTILILPDLAILSSKRKDEKNEIWAKFRDLYDGILNRKTGMGSKECDDAHVTLIGAATPNFRSQQIINNQLGTRELLYSPIQRSEYLLKKLDKAMENDDYEDKMRNELEKTVLRFLRKRKLKTIKKLDEDINSFLNEQVIRIRLIRATAKIDYYTSAIIGEINIESPTRAKKQLKRLFEALLSLDEKYDVERAKNIIKRIVDSSGNQLRMNIIDVFTKYIGNEFRIADIAEKARAHKKMVTIELEFLWQLKWLEKSIRQERIGGYYIDKCDTITGEPIMRGGFLKDVPYYWREKSTSSDTSS